MKKSFIISGGVIVLIFIIMAGWYLLSPLFLDTVVEEQFVLSESSSELAVSSFVDADSFHKVSGKVTIFESSDDNSRILRFENFTATNGPDLKVYLATDIQATDFVSLGELKGNIGSQNYDVSADIDLETYSTVLIWCEQFGVLFGSAKFS